MAQAPTPFGKYQLIERIATGGMAEIYRSVYQAAAGVTKPVVIKKILPHYAGNRNFIQMFVNEAKIAVSLAHGNIAQVFDFGEINGEYFLAMEFVHGHPLSKVLRRARNMDIPLLPIPFAVLITMELCKGLHYAHTRLDETGQPLSIIHRDVSPQNVILSYEGQVKIVDFGIAKARGASENDTESGAVKGKYVYFAPEQARGKELDARTDIFATGIVLYEMLCGRLPFEGKMMDVLGKVIRGEFSKPRAVNAAIPYQLERVVLTAMATDREARYQTAQDFQDALARYLYSYAPTFSTAALASLMAFLYEKEQSAEGIAVRVLPDFSEQMKEWAKPPPSDEEETTHSDRPKVPKVQVDHTQPMESADLAAVAPGSRQVASPRPSGEGRLPTGPKVAPLAAAPIVPRGASGQHTRPMTSRDLAVAAGPTPLSDPSDPAVELRTVPRPSRTDVPTGEPSVVRRMRVSLESLARTPRRWRFIAIPVGAMLLAGAIVLGVGYFSGYSVELTSSPPGAVVLVDGRPASQMTPLLISGLSSDRAHVIEVQAPGHKPWTRRIPPARGTLSVHVDLEADGAPKR